MPATALRRVTAPLLVVALMAGLVIGQATMLARGADHLDAPTVKSDHRIDINDVFVFAGANPGNTVLVMTTNVGAGLLSPTTFHPGAVYEFKIDSSDADAVENWSFRFKFGDVRPDGSQRMNLQLADGAANPTQGGGGRLIGKGRTGEPFGVAGGGMAWAGLADDPFYFDLVGFSGLKAAILAEVGSMDGLTGGELLAAVGANICTADTANFFAGFNTTAIVLELPDAALGGGTINVWAETAIEEGGSLTQVERMGLPTINTVFNHTDPAKEAYNRAEPAGDPALVGGNIAFLVAALTGALDSLGVYPDGFDPAAYAAVIADALTPDVLTYDTAMAADFAALNGRGLNDDVINVAYSVVTNGILVDDCVDEDNDPSGAFPYLDAPN